MQVGLNSSFNSSQLRNERHSESESSQLVPKRGATHQRKKTETKVGGDSAVPLSLLDLHIANPQLEKTQAKPTPQKSSQPASSALSRTSGAKSGAGKREYPVVVKIGALLAKMDDYSAKLHHDS